MVGKPTKKQKNFKIKPDCRGLAENRQRMAAVMEKVTAVARPTRVQRECGCGGRGVMLLDCGELVCMSCYWAVLRKPTLWVKRGE